jgi:hypothetical protein
MKLLSIRQYPLKVLFIDAFLLLLIYLLPAAAHFTGIPVYMMEPMRLALILSIAHTNRFNTFVLAATLPLFSFLLSGHPAFIKMLIITAELLLNVWVFYLLERRRVHPFASMFLAVLLSKIACYLLYWPLISFTFMMQEADPRFIMIQLITTTIFSFYIAFTVKRQKR